MKEEPDTQREELPFPIPAVLQCSLTTTEHQDKGKEPFLRAAGKQNPNVASGDSNKREEEKAVIQVKPSDNK